MSKSIARAVAALIVAGAPLAFHGQAAASGGCAVDNTSTSTSLKVHVEYPPGSVSVESSSLSCSYVSDGGTVNWSCTIVAGTCEVTRNGALVGDCIGKQATCSSAFAAEPGDTIGLSVYGGSGQVADAA